MRPLRLEISGFSAFAEPTVVDFTDVELAAFVGPTGSGKSSVIDAMTFALYGAAARYDQRAVAPVINQLSTEAKVRFDFQLSGTTYTAVRVVRRTRTGATTKEARLEAGGEVLAGDERALSAAVVDLLGLDFDKFNKTVVLPQGRFAEFLHDKPGDRQELLRGLLGVGIYDRVGKAARLRQSAARNTVELLEQQVAGAGDVSDEHLAELTARAEGAEALLRVVDQLAAEIEASDRDLASADRRLEADRASRAVLVAVVVPGGVDELDAAVRGAMADLDLAAAASELARRSADEAAAALAAGPSESAMRLLLREHGALAEAEAAASAAARRLASATAAHESAIGAARAARTRRAAAVDALAGAERDGAAAAEAVHATGDAGDVARLIGLHERRVGAAADAGSAATAAGAAQARLDAAGDERRRAVEARSVAERLAPAAALAEHLVVGQACPVCAQSVAVLPAPHGDAAGHVAAAREAERAAARAVEEAEAANRVAVVEATKRDGVLAAIDEQLAGAPDRPALDALATRPLALQATADAARHLVARSKADLAAVDADPAVADALAGEATAAADLAAARALTGQAEATRRRVADAVAGRPDRAAAAQALAEAEALVTASRLAAGSSRQAAADQRAAEAALAAVQRRERDARHAYDEVRERLAALVAPASTVPPEPVAAWAPARLPTRADALVDDWTALAGWAAAGAARLGEVIGARHQARADVAAGRDRRLAQLAAALADGPTAPPPGRDVDLTTERRRLTDVLVEARAAVATLESERVRLADTRAQIAVARTRADVAGMLGGLLRTDAFERWLLDEALTELVDRANVRLRELTGGQYSLTAADGAFRVVDHRNADEVRDARSLSGGETFLTSLSLALALADSSVDSAAEGGEPIESIFLDEGFGTLDPDTLDVVAGTIEELGSSGRMVGIITHIRELAERMPTRFEVTKLARTSVVERVDV